MHVYRRSFWCSEVSLEVLSVVVAAVAVDAVIVVAVAVAAVVVAVVAAAVAAAKRSCFLSSILKMQPPVCRIVFRRCIHCMHDFQTWPLPHKG